MHFFHHSLFLQLTHITHSAWYEDGANRQHQHQEYPAENISHSSIRHQEHPYSRILSRWGCILFTVDSLPCSTSRACFWSSSSLSAHAPTCNLRHGSWTVTRQGMFVLANPHTIHDLPLSKELDQSARLLTHQYFLFPIPIYE